MSGSYRATKDLTRDKLELKIAKMRQDMTKTEIELHREGWRLFIGSVAAFLTGGAAFLGSLVLVTKYLL